MTASGVPAKPDGVPSLYAIDTNVYIGALRDREQRRELGEFLLRAGRRVRLHPVVTMELRAGARTAAQRVALGALVAAHASRDRGLVPSADAYDEAGRVLADLATKERFDPGAAAPSFRADVLLATSCREAGATLVTANHADFARIARHLRGLRVAAPWPAR